MSPDYGTHILLGGLNEAARHVIEPQLSLVGLAVHQLLFEPDEDLDRIWFVRGGLVSLVTLLDGGREVDGITVGRDGTLGLPVSLGSHRVIGRAVVLVPGEAWSLPGEACRRALALDAAFNARVMRYYEAVFASVVQLTACNAAHTLEQRFCRLLLTFREQLGSNTLPLRQEAISRMLGVNRTSITPVSRALQADGAILVRHGRIQVRDPDRVARRACECHAVTSARMRAVP